jgi:hypothetical protein
MAWLMVDGMACLALGIGVFVTRSNAHLVEPPAEEKIESVLDASADMILAEYRARIDAVLKTLPADASPLDKIKALEPLFDLERIWFLNYDGLVLSNLLYDEGRTGEIWGGVRGRTEYAVAYKVLDATEFTWIHENPQWITKDNVENVLKQLPRLHALGRFVARDTLEKGFKTAMKPEKLDRIYPGKAPATPQPAK